ncbi:CAP domain-containing protein [Brevundimonas sp.]|uniref:CAP domain-containing protein n=1 Tax=Brevundimonas sp. TaxID=1871086 RepID=UPI002D3ADD62|nr:CAP domain-containing protein [Brevundimonas sp.]HYC74923.1 CAP domain-containing protein [Brevundimonas sp.]
MFRTPGLLLAALLASCAPVAASSPVQDAARSAAGEAAVFRADIVAELNAARTDPGAYARKARALRALFRGDRIERPGETALLTREGPAAADEAIAFLEAQTPLPVLRENPGLNRAAADHAREQSRTGAVAHASADGSSPSDRMRRQGRWTATGEAIAYGPHRAEDVILQLIIDDGVPDRGHRRILFNPVYELIGVACAPHPVWREVCVLDFARAA